jgi:3-oxoacyl-[acyl-carrier protein] reductase
MRAGGWGRIVLCTSWAIKQPIPDLAASNVARTGLWAWAKTAAKDLVEDGITLNLALPGPHATDRMLELAPRNPGPSPGPPPVPASRMGDPEDFGKVVAFLCSEPAGFISGAAVPVDGATSAGLL